MSSTPSDAIPGPTRSHWLLGGTLLILLLGLIYGRVWQYDFCNYDDDVYVYQNPAVTGGLSGTGLLWAFTQVHSANWHPLTWLSHMLDCTCYGLQPAGHHLTNVLCHTLNACLLLVLARKLT
ncbi:MAG TPA: hypothetical protein VF607_01160, partial [Verrucomicrobiae bacterium]